MVKRSYSPAKVAEKCLNAIGDLFGSTALSGGLPFLCHDIPDKYYAVKILLIIIHLHV